MIGYHVLGKLAHVEAINTTETEAGEEDSILVEKLNPA